MDTLRRAADEYRSRLLAVRTASQWASATPCHEWTVRDVADHILGGNRFTVLILGGLTPDAAMDDVTHGDYEGDPGQAFEESATAQPSASCRPGVLEKMYEHPMGLISGRQIARLRMIDMVVHAWDLADRAARELAVCAAVSADDEQGHRPSRACVAQCVCCTRGAGYYSLAAIEIATQDGGGKVDLGDGGFVDWTAQFLEDAKERCLISCLSTIRIATLLSG